MSDATAPRRIRMTVIGPILAARTSGGAEWAETGVATAETAATRPDMES